MEKENAIYPRNCFGWMDNESGRYADFDVNPAVISNLVNMLAKERGIPEEHIRFGPPVDYSTLKVRAELDAVNIGIYILGMGEIGLGDAIEEYILQKYPEIKDD